MNLYHGDCLEVLPTFPPASVEAIITDLPYGTTACEWDSIIPLDEMWKQVKRVLKVNGVFVTTSAQPFTSALVMSEPNYYRYEWMWRKNTPSGFAYAKYQPLRYHENILVFGNGSETYNQQETRRSSNGSASRLKYKLKNYSSMSRHTPMEDITKYHNPESKSPESVLEIDTEPNSLGKYHETQKPVALYEYLIRTYTNAGETVLDICMGSGTTGVAAIQTGRNFIGIEKEQKYFEIASRRIAQAPQPLFTEPPRQPTQREPDLKLESGKLEGFE